MLGKYKNTLIASLGSGVEYYDFIVYALMSPYLSKVFFNNSDYLQDIIHFFSIFALGYLFRPVGGVILGYISDQYGRKTAFLWATSLMCISTFIIGFLPVGHIDHSVAIGILILCRALQGISFGGELSNAITFVYESNKNKYLHGSFIFTSVGVGNVLAIFVVTLLGNLLSQEQIMAFWWRIPFIFGGLLMLICFLFRCNLEETRKQNNEKREFFDVMKKFNNYILEIFLGILLSLAIASLIVTNLFFPAYFNVFYSYDPVTIYRLMMYSILFAIVSSPCFGFILSKSSDKPTVFIIGSVMFVLALFSIISVGVPSISRIFILMATYQIFIGFFFVLTLPFMTSLLSHP